MSRRFRTAVVVGNAIVLGAAAWAFRGGRSIDIQISDHYVGLPSAVSTLATWALVAWPITAAAMLVEWALRRRRLSHQL